MSLSVNLPLSAVVSTFTNGTVFCSKQPDCRLYEGLAVVIGHSSAYIGGKQCSATEYCGRESSEALLEIQTHWYSKFFKW